MHSLWATLLALLLPGFTPAKVPPCEPFTLNICSSTAHAGEICKVPLGCASAASATPVLPCVACSMQHRVKETGGALM